MKRSHYNLILSGIEDMTAKVMLPFLGLTVNDDVITRISEEVTAFNAAIIEVVHCLNSGERPDLEDDGVPQPDNSVEKIEETSHPLPNPFFKVSSHMWRKKD